MNADAKQRVGAPRINIYLSRLIYALMFFVSPAASTSTAFLWVLLPSVAVPWCYVFANYIVASPRQEVQ
jgi:hypothetical protein